MKTFKFTLLELLVVLAVIGVLVSILMPSLGKARQKGRMAVCMSNTKQIGIAWALYLKNSGGRFWKYVPVHSDTTEDLLWPDYLKEFTTADVHNCAEVILDDLDSSTFTKPGKYRKGTSQIRWVDLRGETTDPWTRSSYGFNLSLTIAQNNGDYVGDVKIYKNQAFIDNPYEVPLIGDAVWRGAKDNMKNNNLRVVPLNLSEPKNSANIDGSSCKLYRFITNRHGKVTVMSFVDGSSRVLSYENVFRQQWHGDWDKDLTVINPY